MSTPAAPAAKQTQLNGLPAEPAKSELLKAVGKAVFGSAFDEQKGLDTFQQYFEYYENQIGDIQQEAGTYTLVPPWADKQKVVGSHEELLELMRLLRQHKENDKKTIKERLKRRTNQGNPAALEWAVNTAIRLTFIINVRDQQTKHLGGLGRPHLEWPDDQSLENFFVGCFPKPLWTLEAKESRPDPHFTAPFMVEVCGMQLGWTDSLEDHLRLDRGQHKLWVFPHKAFMQALLKNEEFSGYTTWYVIH